MRNYEKNPKNKTKLKIYQKEIISVFIDLFLVVKIKTINGTLQAVPAIEDLNTVFNFIFEYSFNKMVLKVVTDIVYA